MQGGISLVDILIATPGRLMDHLRSTPGFSLQHVRYLVVDEADRLLTQSFQDWLPTILAALKPSEKELDRPDSAPAAGSGGDAMAPLWWRSSFGDVASDLQVACHSSVRTTCNSALIQVR